MAVEVKQRSHDRNELDLGALPGRRAAVRGAANTAFQLERVDRHSRVIAISVRHGHLVRIGVMGPCLHLRLQGQGALWRCRGQVPLTLSGHPET